MKAMILAAGLGTRLRPLTLEMPKPMVKVGGIPLIEWHVQRLVAAGIKEVVINTAWLGHQLEAYLQDGSRWGIKIDWSHEQEPLETAGGIKKALPLLGKEPFILVNGDIWTDYPFTQLVEKKDLLAKKMAHLVLVPNPIQHPQGDFALEPSNAAISNIKPLSEGLPWTAYTFSGISLLHPDLFSSFLAEKGPLAPLLKQAMREDLVTGELWSGKWEDIGTLERLEKINHEFKSNNFV